MVYRTAPTMIGYLVRRAITVEENNVQQITETIATNFKRMRQHKYTIALNECGCIECGDVIAFDERYEWCNLFSSLFFFCHLIDFHCLSSLFQFCDTIQILMETFISFFPQQVRERRNSRFIYPPNATRPSTPTCAHST